MIKTQRHNVTSQFSVMTSFERHVTKTLAASFCKVGYGFKFPWRQIWKGVYPLMSHSLALRLTLIVRSVFRCTTVHASYKEATQT